VRKLGFDLLKFIKPNTSFTILYWGCPKSGKWSLRTSLRVKQSFIFVSKMRLLRSARNDKITFWTTPGFGGLLFLQIYRSGEERKFIIKLSEEFHIVAMPKYLKNE